MPADSAHQAACGYRCECGPERNHAATDRHERADAVARCHPQHRVDHERDEDAASNRLHQASCKQQCKAAGEQSHNRAYERECDCGVEQDAQRYAPIQKRHGHHDHGCHDHIPGDKPLCGNRRDTVVAHDGHERHVRKVLIETAHESPGVKHYHEREAVFALFAVCHLAIPS